MTIVLPKPLIALLMFAIPSSLALIAVEGQGVIPDEPLCSNCSIVVREPILSIGGPADEMPLPAGITDIAVDATERVWLASSDAPLMVFDQKGRFISNVGRQGSGPGEYQGGLKLTNGTSSMIALDANSRAVVVSSALEPVSTVQLEFGRISDVAFFEESNTLFVTGAYGQANRVRRPFTLVDLSLPTARHSLNFGPDLEDRSSAVGHYRLRHVVGMPREGRVWVAEQLRYHVSAWSATGEKLQSLRREPAWFPSFSKGTLGGPETAPHPSIIGISEDHHGYLWVFVRTAAPDWRSVWGRWTDKNGLLLDGEYPSKSLPLPWELTTTVAEVLDPRAGRVLHRGVIESFVISVLPGPRIATYSESDPEYSPRVRILTLQLTGLTGH